MTSRHVEYKMFIKHCQNYEAVFLLFYLLGDSFINKYTHFIIKAQVSGQLAFLKTLKCQYINAFISNTATNFKQQESKFQVFNASC